jgi:hypothetical protein
MYELPLAAAEVAELRFGAIKAAVAAGWLHWFYADWNR